MYNSSFYFPSLNMFVQPPPRFLKAEEIDEEIILKEYEDALDKLEYNHDVSYPATTFTFVYLINFP